MADHTVNWEKYLSVASISDIGMRRTSNQDSYAITMSGSLERFRDRGHLFLVADGMGAHAAGELASKLASEKIPQLYGKYTDISPPEALKKSVIEANGIINRKGRANEEFFNMGTTCSALVLLAEGGIVAHVGDSRVYRLRGHRFEQLTFDHSLVWEMRASGQISSEEAATNLIPKNVITRSLGPYPEVSVDLEGPVSVETGDTFLLCSDGLTGLLADEEIGAILANFPPHEAVRVLTDLTNLRGGPDNITVIVVRINHRDLTTEPAHHRNWSLNEETRPNKSRRKIHPLAWVFLAGSTAASVLFGLMTQSPLAIAIPGALALITLIYVLVRLMEMSQIGAAKGTGKQFGKGPYTSVNCDSGVHFIEKLETMVADVRQALANDRRIDLHRLDAMIEHAKQDRNQNDSAATIKGYSQAIRFAMDQIRNSGASDSAVDL